MLAALVFFLYPTLLILAITMIVSGESALAVVIAVTVVAFSLYFAWKESSGGDSATGSPA